VSGKVKGMVILCQPLDLEIGHARVVRTPYCHIQMTPRVWECWFQVNGVQSVMGQGIWDSSCIAIRCGNVDSPTPIWWHLEVLGCS
jgi:hypothetical protein